MFTNFEQVDHNVKEEYDLIDEEKDHDTKSAFYKKVALLEKKVPQMMGVWKKLNLDEENVATLKKIQAHLHSIKDKD